MVIINRGLSLKVNELNREISMLRNSSFNEARELLRNGRVSQRGFDWYCLAWNWMTWRFTSIPQERFYDKCGKEALIKRMDRVRKIIDRKIDLMKKEISALNGEGDAPA